MLHKGLLHSTCIDGVYQQKGTQTPHDQHGLPLDIFEEVFKSFFKLDNLIILLGLVAFILFFYYYDLIILTTQAWFMFYMITL